MLKGGSTDDPNERCPQEMLRAMHLPGLFRRRLPVRQREVQMRLRLRLRLCLLPEVRRSPMRHVRRECMSRPFVTTSGSA